MNTSNHQPNNYLCCSVPSHQDCELSTICTNSTCPSRGFICYLCPFVKPHSDHSQHDIVPVRLVNRTKTGKSRQALAAELERELQSKQTAHLKQVQKVKEEILDAFARYEKKINDEFLVLKNELCQEEEDPLEKFEKKAFKDMADFKKTSELILQRIHKKDASNSGGQVKWVYENAMGDSSQLLSNTRAYLLSLQFQYKITKEHLASLVEETFHFPILDLNIEDYMSEVLFKDSYFAEQVQQEASPSTCRTSDKSYCLSELVGDKMRGALSSSVDGKSPKKMEELGEDNKKQRARPPTFGKKPDLALNPYERDEVVQEGRYREDAVEICVDNRRNAVETVKQSKRRDDEYGAVERNRIEEYDEYNRDNYDEPLDYTIVNDNESDAEFKSTMMETDTRFIMGKDQLQRLLRKPDEKFDAVTFYPKTKDVHLEGFGFYVPLPCEGSQVILEYRVYEGTQKEGKEIMREEVMFECDITSVKESAVMERILLKIPVILERKKWYTLVLSYVNEVKVAYEGGKWRDVGPFVFLGVEKRQVKEWLGMKTIEAEKMYTSQFPYLIYSEI